MLGNATVLHVICSYDIADPKRLARVHRYLSQRGLAVNYSVFYLNITAQQLVDIKKALKRLIKPQSDSLQFYAAITYAQAELLGQLAPSGVMLYD